MKKVLLLLILSSFVHYSSCHRRNEFGQTLAKAGIIGAGAAGLYGGFKFLSWLFTRTDEHVIADVNRLLQETGCYQAMDSILLQYRVNSSTAYLDESCLYDLGYEKIQDDYIDTYISKLYHVMRRLRNEKRELYHRMLELPSYDTLRSQMNHLYQQITTRLPRIELLHGVMKHHRSYYLLFEFESDMISSYEMELNSLNQSYNDHALETKLKRKVMAHNSNRYPYMSYIEMIESDVETLKNKINRLSLTYPDRISAAKDLEQQLHTIKTILLGTHEYHMEFQMYKKEQWERERYEINRQLEKMYKNSGEYADPLDDYFYELRI